MKPSAKHALQRSVHRVLPIILFLAFSAISQAIAAEASKSAPEAIASPSLTASLVRVIGALSVVFAILFGGAWLTRNWQRLTVRNGRAPKLNVLEVKSLGARHALYVVGYEKQRFLLSSSPVGIAMLTALPEADESETTAVIAPPSFAEALTKALSPLGAGKGNRS